VVTSSRGLNKKAYAPLLWRVSVFIFTFIILSGIIGPRIIANGLIGTYGFQIYGGAGKSLLFGVIAFILLADKKIFKIKLKPWRFAQIFWIIAAGLALCLGLFGVNKLIAGTQGMLWPIVVHVCLLTSVAGAAFGIFGPGNIRLMAKKYKRELLLSAVLAAAFLGFLYLVYALWPLLAAVVLHAVAGLLRLSGLTVVTPSPQTIVLNKFGIEISKYCSGIDSIALFTALYALVGVLDWPRLNHKKYTGLFLPAIALLFGCNIVRVFVLILAGYYINPHIAFSLFHTYAGMVFFIIYSGLFWTASYRWMLHGND
jgi:exosortase/archaeosortase family protein